jgi:hypothetical protein
MGYGGSGLQHIAKSTDALWHPASQATGPSRVQLRQWVRRWNPAAVVAVTRRDSRLGRLLTTVFGPPSFSVGRVLAWRR